MKRIWVLTNSSSRIIDYNEFWKKCRSFSMNFPTEVFFWIGFTYVNGLGLCPTAIISGHTYISSWWKVNAGQKNWTKEEGGVFLIILYLYPLEIILVYYLFICSKKGCWKIKIDLLRGGKNTICYEITITQALKIANRY